ncbi:MerR family transcriptional regulator [Jiangella rhizosphaerae]|uniref:MerR family transcriptional regulator n=1 Tax=Jiangella rhizosphaerae TaxID=2293569 RepID=A0A418KXZ5_9ACTN|nr:MerR family transcriptional regulator [Jiangella rhizosphaerae]RIQ36992.1 MerR family transcriptional regulator [Jiangella rhizosphaerae]
MEDARRLSIGQVARLAGVTPKTLRHYDRLGVLRPADVDPVTGYRWYLPDQVDQLRLVRRLRELELPLEDVRRLMALVDDRDAFRSALAEHRRRIDARVVRLRGILHTIDHALNDEEWTTMSASAAPAVLDPELHRRLGADLFNDTWRLMELEDRSPDDDVLMIHQAHASAYHWLQVGTPQNVARSHWLRSRVYCVVGRAEPALFHARLVLSTCQENGIGDWDLAFAYEALARAYAVDGDPDEARRHAEQARLASADITTDEDREWLLSDLETIPFAG